MLDLLRHHFRLWANASRRQAIAEAYRPIVHGFLAPAIAYYLFVTWGHFQDETSWTLAILSGLSLSTAALYLLLWRSTSERGQISIGRLETIGVITNAAMFANVVVYLHIHFVEDKLIYFALMAVVFSTSGVTLRSTIGSVLVSIAAMLWLAFQYGTPERAPQFAFIGVATAFASLGMATLLRKAILRQIDARLLADKTAAMDILTGIPNRRSVFATMETIVATQEPFWLGILDLDGFKSVNDVYGHAIGDTLLGEAVSRVVQHIPNDVVFGRVGGDEFMFVMRGEAKPTVPTALGDAVLAEIAKPYRISELTLTISGTIGFAEFPTMGSTVQQIYEKADFAMYRGKRSARGRTSIFTAAEDAQLREHRKLERVLREADLDKELHLVFQPQVDTRERRYIGFEALARWNSPKLGNVPPDKFIRAAERAGLIQTMTRTLFGKGLDALACWRTDVSISFNLSAQDISDRPFIFSLVAEVMKRGIEPGRIEFEITETAVMRDIEVARTLLTDLSQMGFKIALDDFGSGHSSFQYIDELPLDKLKIDKSFVRKVATSPVSKEIVSGVLTLCRNLDLVCVLEGVETEAELETLAQLGGRIIQGYLFGKPMDNTSVIALLERVPASGLRT